MTRKIMNLASQGIEYNIVFHAGIVNPFHIVKKYYTYDASAARPLKKHTKTVEKYADLKSCLLWLVDNVPNTEGM